MIPAVWQDREHLAIAADRLLPIVHPFNPVCVVIAFDHVTGERNKQGAQLCNQAIGLLARCAIVTRITTCNKRKWLGRIRRSTEPIALADASGIFEDEIILGVRQQTAQAGKTVVHAAIVHGTVH